MPVTLGEELTAQGLAQNSMTWAQGVCGEYKGKTEA